MNSNNKDKVKNFFRKEGFYFVLFICLCVIATVAVFTINRNNTANNKKANNEFSLNVEEKSNNQSQDVINEKIQNAERVENNTNENVDEVANSTEADKQVSDVTQDNSEEVALEDSTEGDVAVMAGSESGIVFSLPLDGAVTRCFGEMIEVKNTDEEQIIMTRKGVDLQASVGTAVKCVADGQVEEVASNSEDGNYVVVSHANGLKTKYANLDPEINVSVGDVVTEGQEIGLVGDSSLVFTSDICGEVLNLQVIDANGVSVDPSSYFNFQ